MAEGKQLNVELTFNANVSNARKAMKTLQQDLDKLSAEALTLNAGVDLDKDLIRASQAAARLKLDLESAFNTKTGNLDLVKFNQSMKSAGMSAQEYRQILSTLGPAGDQAFAQLSMSIMKADAPLTRVNSRLNEFATSLKNAARWQISSSVLHGLMSSVNQAFSYAESLNASLNDIRIVTGASADEMSRFATSANNAAKSLSTSTRAYADAALIFYQQGLGDAEVKERTDAVIKMANVTKDSAEQVSSYMTAIWNNFDDGSKSLEHYADVMTALGAATAASTAEIADGLEKFASIGKTIGLSYDYATSALATIVSQTRQSADTVGTGLRTIFSRLQGLSLGETLEDGVDLNKYSKALRTVGVEILDASGNMKDMDNILDSLAGKWSNLSRAQKTALAQTVGGVRQYTTLISLMDNWNDMEANLVTARSSTGALQEQADIYAESWDAAKTRVKASAEAIYSSLINDKFFIQLNNGFSGFLDQINNLIQGLGGLKGVLLSLTPIVTAIFRDQITSGLRNTMASIKNLTPAGRKEERRTRESFIEETAKMYSDTDTPGGHAMADQYKRTAKLQGTYLKGSSRMNDEEKARAQQLLTLNENMTTKVQTASAKANESDTEAQKANTKSRVGILSEAQARQNEIDKMIQEELAQIEKDKQQALAALGKAGKNKDNKKVKQINANAERRVNEARHAFDADSAAIRKNAEAANKERAKLAENAKKSGFEQAATEALMKIKVDDKDIPKAKEQILSLVNLIKQAAIDQGIDLGSADEDGSFAKSLEDIAAAANDAKASVESLEGAKDGVAAATSAGKKGPNPEAYEKAAQKAGMGEAEAQEDGEDIIATNEELGRSLFDLAEASRDADKAAEETRKRLEELGHTKVDFAEGFVTSISAITAAGAAISSVTGLMDLWGDESASVGEKILGTITTIGSVVGTMGAAFGGANGEILKSMATTLAAKMGWTGLLATLTGTAATAPVAGSSVKGAGILASIGGWIAQTGWAPFLLIMVAVVAAVALVIGIFTALVAAGQAVADAYNADAVAAEKAAETAKSLAAAYSEAQEKYTAMIEAMDKYQSAREALDSLTEGTQEYNAALAEANEAGLALINSASGLKRGEDYRWENGELIIDQDAMDRIKQEESERVAQTRAASLMADANAAKAKAKADQTAFVRENDASIGGTAAAAAAAGAAIGSFIPVIGTALGAVIGGIGGLAGSLIYNGVTNDKENERIDALTKQYQTMGEEAFDDANLKALGFDTANKAYIKSLKEVVEATVAAADQTSNAARLAAQEILATDETYQRMDAEDKDRLGAASGRMYQTYQAEAEAKYLEQAQSRGWFKTGNKESKEAWEKYADLTGIEDLNGYKVENYAGKGDDARVEYSYIDEEGERQTREVTAQQIAAELAAAEAAEKLGQSTEFLISEFNRLEGSTNAVDKALSDFLAGDMTQASKSEAEAMSDAFNGDHEIDASQASSYLATKFGDGKGILTDAEAQKYGYKSAAAMAEAFQEEYNNTMKAWDSIELPGGIGEWGESLSLEAAQSLENIISELNLGPMGEAAGEKFVAGLNTMLAGVKPEDQTAALNQLMAIDWSDWDALSQADAILQEFGVDIDLTSQEWLDFAESMRIAARAVPDFSQLKSNLNSISKILGSLEFGEAIDEDDYNTLVEYNQEWSKFFVTQADGSRKFIGDAEAMAAATRDLALEHKNLLETYSAAAQNDDISSFNWDQEITEETLDQARSDFEALRNGEKSGALLNPVLEALGYDEEAIAAALADPKKLQAMFDAIYEAIDPAYLDQIDAEFKEMYASTATSVEELQTMLSEGIIDEGTYSKSLLAMASGYENCTSAVEDYQEALASGNEEAISAAESALEAAVTAEQAAEKYEQMYTNAFSGRANMTVADLKLLKETNEELYNSFLTMSDAEWLAASYEAYSEWLDTQLASYAVDSEAYRALMLEKRALDEEYYNYIQKQQENLLEILDENYEKQINAVDSVVDILSELSSGEKVFSDLSFEELFELEKQLKEIGYTTEQVDELLKNLGKDEKKTDKESVLAAMRAEVDMLLSGIAATNAQKEMRYDGLTTTLTIDSVVLGDNVPQRGDQIYISATTDPIEVSAVGSETVEETSGDDGPGWKVKGDVKGPDDVDIKVGAVGTGKMDPSLTKFAQGAFASFNGSTGAMATFGVDLETTTADGDTQSAGRLYWNGSSLVFSSTPVVGNVAFGAQLAEGDDTTQFIYEGGKLTLNSQVVTAEGTIDVVGVISSGENTGELTYDTDNGFGFVGDTPNGPEIFCTFKPSSDIESVLSYNGGVWTLTGMTESGIPIKLTYTNEGLPEILKSLTQLSKEHPLVAGGKIDPRDGFSSEEIFLYYEWVNLNPQTPIEELEGQTARVGVEYYDASDPSRSGGAISSITTVQGTLRDPRFQGMSAYSPESVMSGADLLNTETGRQLMRELGWDSTRIALLDPYKGSLATPGTNATTIAGDTANYDNLFALMDTLKKANADMDDISAITQSWVADTQKTNAEIENMVATLVLLMEEGFFGEVGSSTYQMGAWLMHGLIEGWSGTDTSAFPSACVTILGSIGKSLEVASPSKATIRMGKWLMEGLNIGWNSVEFDAGNIQGKILNAIAKELENIDHIDIGNIPLTYNADGDDTNADTVADLEDTWLGSDLRKESSLLQDYDPRRVQLRYMEGYLMSRDGGIDENETPTLFNADGSMAIDGDNLSASQQTILQQAFGTNYTATTNAEGKIVIDVETEGVEDLVFDNWSQAYEHAVSSAFTEAKMPEWLSGNANGTPREGLDKVTDAIVSQAVEDYLAQNNMSDMTVQDAINQLGLDTVLEGIQGVIDQGYGELNNYSEKSWAKIKDSWIAGAQKVLSIENEAAKEYYDLWVATFEAIVEARKIIFEEGNLGLELDEKTIAQLATDAILNSNGTFDPTTWLNNLFNPEENNITDYALPAYQSGVLGTDAQFLKYNAAGFLSSDQSASAFGSAYQQHFTNQWMGHMTEEALAPYMLLLNTLQANGGDAEAARAAVLNDPRAAEYGIGAATYDKMMNDANLFKALGIIAQAAPGQAYGYNASSEEADALLDQWIGSNGDLSEILYQVFATTLGGQMGVEADYRQQLYRDGEARYNAEMDRISADQAIVQKAMKDGIESLTRTERDELDRIMEEGNYSSLEDANVGLARSADAAAAGLDRLTAALGQGLTTDGNGNWFDPNAVTGQARANTPTFDSISAAQEYAAQNGIDIGTWSQTINPETQKMTGLTSTSIQQNADGSYYLRSDVVPASSVITEGSSEWEGLAPEGTEHTDNAYLTAAQAAGFSDLAEQDSYIREAETRTIIGVNGEEKNLMATEDEIIMSEMEGQLAQTVEGWNDLTEAEQNNMAAEKAANLTAEERAELLKEAEKRQRKYANELKKMEKAYDRLAKEGRDLLKTANDEEASMSERVAAVDGLREIYTDILGPMDKVGDAFVKNADNMKLAEEAAAGNEESLNKLQVAYLEALAGVDFQGPLQDLAAEVAAWDPGDLEVGATIDDTDFLAKCAELVNKAGLTADQASDALSAMGVDAEIEEHEVPIGEDGTTTIQAQGTIYVPKVDENGNVSYEAVDATGGYTIEGESGQTVKYYTIKGAKYNGKGVTGGGGGGTGGGRRGGGGGGGGGGGRRDPRRANHVKKEDYAERYHEIDNVIDDLADAYERLNKEEDRAWGKNRIDAMKEQTKVIKDQIAATEEKIRQAKEYLEGYYDTNGKWVKGDRQAAEDMGWEFDADGNVSNYDEFMEDQVNKYNAAIDAYNGMSAEAQEELDKKYQDMKNEDGEYYSGYEDYLKQTLLDDPKEALEQYEETMELLEDLGMDYDDLLNEWHDNIIGQIQTKLDTTLEVTEAQLGYLEHKLSRIEDDAYSAAEAIGLMGQQMDIAQTQFNAHKSALDDLLKAYSPEGTVWSAEDLMNGNISSEDLVNAGMQSGDIELIQTIMEGMMDASEQMSEQMVNSIEHMANAFEEFNADMDRYISTVEHAQAITSTYRNIIDLTGRTMSGFNSTMLKSINDAIAAQSIAKLEANKTKYETVKTEYDEAKAAYEAAQASYAEGGIDAAALKAAKDTYQTAQDNMNEAQEAFLSSWEEALQAAADAFQSNMEAAVRDIGEMMSGGLAGGLAELEDAFAKMNERDQNYVDDYEKIYQLTKMTRDLTDKIDSTSNIRAQKELLKYQKELNGLLESDQEMSAYDLDYLQKKLDLKLAEIALDEAQNAKSQVTMRRDSEGNYNYVYTADENAVEKAESDYADRLYEMQKANDEYITGLSENMANLSSQMLSEIAAIDTTIYDTEEKYQAEVQRITDHYTSQMEYYNSEMNKVLGNNKTLYEQDWTNFSKYTGYKLSAEENYVTKWNQTVLSQVTGFETQEEFYQNFNEAVFGGDPAHPSGESLIGRLVTAYKTMREQIAAANAAAGVETEDLATALLGNIEAATQEAEAAADDITEAATEIVTQITSIGDAVTNMVNNYSQAMATMEAETDAMLGVLLDFLTAYGEIGDLDIEPSVLAEIEERRRARQENPEGYDTGGYTGAWGSEGRLAYLHQKELVLNAEDTANMLASVGILRQIANVIDLNALASAGGFISLMSSGVAGNQGTLQQEVHIEASFPAVTDKNQIEEAFGDLVNLAAQYANRKL